MSVPADFVRASGRVPHANPHMGDEGYVASAEGEWGLTAGPRLVATGTTRGGQTTRRVLLAVKAHPGLSIRYLAGALGLSSTNTLYHVRKLATLGLVLLDRRRSALQVYPVREGAGRGRRLSAEIRPLPMAAIHAPGGRKGEAPAGDPRRFTGRAPSRPDASEAVSP